MRRSFCANCARSLLAATVTGLFSSVYAAQSDEDTATPEIEFLEFLGQFETDAGEWIDPDSLLTGEFTELLDAPGEVDNDAASTDDTTSNDQ